jgi:hypothetical protein
MPEVPRFFGIVITMHYNDHPPPHFHARYGGQKATVDIETLAILDGRLAPRVRGLVTEWGSRHRRELRENWRRLSAHAPLARIEPLE